jgi:hypothetical protein
VPPLQYCIYPLLYISDWPRAPARCTRAGSRHSTCASLYILYISRLGLESQLDAHIPARGPLHALFYTSLDLASRTSSLQPARGSLHVPPAYIYWFWPKTAQRPDRTSPSLAFSAFRVACLILISNQDNAPPPRLSHFLSFSLQILQVTSHEDHMWFRVKIIKVYSNSFITYIQSFIFEITSYRSDRYLSSDRHQLLISHFS